MTRQCQIGPVGLPRCTKGESPPTGIFRLFDPYAATPAVITIRIKSALQKFVDLSDVEPEFGSMSLAVLRLWARGLAPAFLVLLVPHVIQLGGTIASYFSEGAVMAEGIPLPIWIFIIVPLLMASEAGATLLFADQLQPQGQSLSSAAAFYRGFSIFGRVLHYYAVLFLATAACFVPAVFVYALYPPAAIPAGLVSLAAALWIWARWIIALPIIVLDRCSVGEAMSRSSLMVRGHGASVFLLTLAIVGGAACVCLMASEVTGIARSAFELTPDWSLAMEAGFELPLTIGALALCIALRVVAYRVLPPVDPQAQPVRLASLSDTLAAAEVSELLAARTVPHRLEVHKLRILGRQFPYVRIIVVQAEAERAREIYDDWRSAVAAWDRDDEGAKG